MVRGKIAQMSVYLTSGLLGHFHVCIKTIHCQILLSKAQQQQFHCACVNCLVYLFTLNLVTKLHCNEKQHATYHV